MSRTSRRAAVAASWHRAPAVIAALILVGLSSGCYHYRLRANGNPLNSTYFRRTLDTSSNSRQTGFVVPPTEPAIQGTAGLPSSADCKANGLYEVAVTSKWTSAAGTVFSFGHRSQVDVEWLCAKEAPVIGPTGAHLRPSSPAGSPNPGIQGERQTGGPEVLRRRTVHSFFWGAVQQNLLPPAPASGSKTPATCKSMSEVRLPMSYGYAVLTVFTAGIWSPMRVGWRCTAEGGHAVR